MSCNMIGNASVIIRSGNSQTDDGRAKTILPFKDAEGIKIGLL